MVEQSEDDSELEQLGFGAAFEAELADMLSSVQLLSDLEGADIQVLTQYFSGYMVRKGGYVFKEGGKSKFMCLIVDGRIEILKDGGKKITTVRTGKSMGEMSMIDGYPHSATARAVEDTKLVLITRTKFQQLCEEQPALAVKLFWDIARLMSLRLRQTTGMLCDYIG
jgi:CRP-like cAMP-binding protein